MKNSLPITFCLFTFASFQMAEASDLGITGLIDTPTARMRPDGEFSPSISRQQYIDIYALTYQTTPWLEATFRYSAFADGLFDRSYELKARLISEGAYMPELAVGVRDLLGTGVLSSEYLVANKAFGSLDLSIGLGWGRFASRPTFSNPLTEISSNFEERDSDFGLGGKVSLSSFFSGPDVGVFGGIAYEYSPLDVTFTAEYNSDNYDRERAKGTVVDPSPLSYGIEWDVSPSVSLGLSHQFGEEWGLRISSRLDSTQSVQRYEPPVYILADDLIRFEATDPDGFKDQFDDLDLSSWYTRLSYDMQAHGLTLLQASSNSDGVSTFLVVENRGYALAADAIDVALHLADRNLPKSFSSLNLILSEKGIQPVTLNFYRSANGFESPGIAANILPGREIDSPFYEKPIEFGTVALNVGLDTRLSLFDPDDPLRYQAFLRLNATSDLGFGWKVNGSYIRDIYNNFDEISRPSDSVLPRVRSDSARYLREGDSGIDSLYADTRANLKGDVFYRLYAGILEEMYSGIGGELLYQPFRSRLAYGFSANWVKQRDFDKSFNHLDYEVITAFASIYWATPWYNYDVSVHAGRYLAKDIGATLEVKRTFDNGWAVGAWATLTDVPFEDFGEGSFDKGLYFRIPFHSLFGINTRGAQSQAIRSVQRDGGQYLEGFSGRLWDDLRSTRYDAIHNNRDRISP